MHDDLLDLDFLSYDALNLDFLDDFLSYDPVNRDLLDYLLRDDHLSRDDLLDDFGLAACGEDRGAAVAPPIRNPACRSLRLDIARELRISMPSQTRGFAREARTSTL